MMHIIRIAFVIAPYCLVVLTLNACGGTTTTAPTATNQTATANSSNTQSIARAPAVAASPKAATPAAGSTGEFVDTSKYDAEIKQLEERAKKNPADQQTRISLAKAYTARGDALTGVRQYNAALGDYRRALRNDPNNEQARQMAGTIISIYKGMGRDVPLEGHELPPIKQ
jgi:cytochrome c-type biogenesis protein CcmH/NrfG